MPKTDMCHCTWKCRARKTLSFYLHSNVQR
jgi:hypothetical protein